MLCYVGKATKIFFCLVAALAVIGLITGLGLLGHSRAAHKIRARPESGPGLCTDGGGNNPCGTITNFPDPDPATTAVLPPPPPLYSVPGPTVTGVLSPAMTSPPSPIFVAPPPVNVGPPGPVGTAAPPPVIVSPPADVVAAPPPVIAGPVGPGMVTGTVGVSPVISPPGPVAGALSPGQA